VSRLSDPLDQHLRLRAGQELGPYPVGDLAVERLGDGLRHLLAGQGLLESTPDGVLLDEHAHDRPLDSRAPQRADDRLLDGILDRLVDAGRPGDAPGPAGPGAEHARSR
jgi:hypothetical protein